MCGIAGWLSYSQNLETQRDTLQRMTDTMRLRGPDAGGLWINGPVGLGHRRLSIIDLAGGAQPMATPEGDVVVSFNGEIYNFQEVRAELEAKNEGVDAWEAGLRATLPFHPAGRDPEQWLVMGFAAAFAVLGTTLSRSFLDRMSDKQFYHWTRRVILALGAVYIGQGVWMMVNS